MRNLMIVALLFVMSGCTSIKSGEARVVENRVLGMDLSVPVPGTEGLSNVINLKFGWIETKFYHTKDVKIKSNADHKNISLIGGKGTIHRVFEITHD